MHLLIMAGRRFLAMFKNVTTAAAGTRLSAIKNLGYLFDIFIVMFV